MPGYSAAECWYPKHGEEQAPAPPPNTAGAVAPGFCAPTEPGTGSRYCDTGSSGSWATTKWKEQTLAACVAKAKTCKRANYVSFSAEKQDCSWYVRCNVDELQGKRQYQTEVLHPQPMPAPTPAPAPGHPSCHAGTCSPMAVVI